MMNELLRNQCDVTNHQVNVQFLLQHQPEWQRSQQAATRNRGKAIVNSLSPTYDQQPTMVAEDDEMSKEKEINKLMALISLSFKKIYKPTNNNLRTSSNTNRANQDNTPRINRGTGECHKPKRAKDAAYHKEKMLLCKQEEAEIQLSAEQADWRDDTNDELDDQELEAHYLYMAQIQEVTPDTADNSGPIFDAGPLQKVQNDDDNYNVFTNDKDGVKTLCTRVTPINILKPINRASILAHSASLTTTTSHIVLRGEPNPKELRTQNATDNSGPIFDVEPLQKIQNNDDNYNVFAIDSEHPEQPESVNDTYLEEQGDTNITIDSLDMSTHQETVDQDDDDLANERDLLASLIEKLKCEIDDNKNRNKFLESSNKDLVDKLKGEIEDFKTKNKSLETSNNHFKEANNELSKTNQWMFKDLKKFQAERDRYHVKREN
ncbi:hypothetical protein Tco_1396752 [Tanacetum coccineum]